MATPIILLSVLFSLKTWWEAYRVYILKNDLGIKKYHPLNSTENKD